MNDLKFRFKILFCIFAVIILAIIVKLYILSVGRYDYYNSLSVENTIKTETLVPIRGQILDRNNTPLAINELGFTLFLKTRLNDLALQTELDLIKLHIVDADIELLKNKYKQFNSIYRRIPVNLIDFIPYSQMQVIHSSLIQSKNIIISPTTKRYYPNSTSASHIIGYIGASDVKDIYLDPISKYTKIIGKQGLEKQYNKFLQGELGYKKIQVNSLNQQLKIIDEKPALSNNDMKVSLDMRLQELIDDIFKDKNGAAIIMDSTNGEILAAGSYPEYDINDFVNGISSKKYKLLLENPHNPLINKIINGQYPPGSVVKMGMGLAFLEYAGVNERTKIDTPYSINVAGHNFRDWKIGGHGESDLIKAIRESVDVYFYKLSQIAGIGNIANVMKQMGFGELSGVDLPYENSGVFPTPEWKMRSKSQRWVMGDTIVSSIGQGSFLATPMQVARYTALIASGKLVKPHFAKVLGSEEIDYEPEDVLNNFQKSNLGFLREGMYQVCSNPKGTAFYVARGSKVKIACKTGTAQVVGIPQDVVRRQKEDEMAYFRRSQAWISAFIPYNNPKYVVTILVEHGGSGGRNGPLLVQIVNKMHELGYVK